jgi:peptide-methionine (S)-S-oxide reductase
VILKEVHSNAKHFKRRGNQMGMIAAKLRLPTREQALPGRKERMPVADLHYVTGAPMRPPFAGMESAMFGLGCFWGAERKFWEAPGVFSTAVGYAGGYTPNPTYEEVCSGLTGHAEVVRLAYDPDMASYEGLLKVFWESHDPTQGMRQGNDIGTQYRSGDLLLFRGTTRGRRTLA